MNWYMVISQRFSFFCCLALLLISTNGWAQQQAGTSIRFDTCRYFDLARNREIPVAIYQPTSHTTLQVVIFSHGYGQNQPDTYLHYTYLTEFLARRGYYVVSIQHDLPTDSIIPASGIPQVVRRPFWEQGADNILFVLNELKKRQPDLDFNHTTLIGHSNGGDITALFAQKFPNLVSKIITLDNRRMPLPRTMHPGVYSLRSSDQPADEGVLPTAAEAVANKIRILKLPHTNHNDMDDRADGRQRKEIQDKLLSFLRQ